MRVVAAVIQDLDKVLACRRAEHKNLPGKWEFPGGKVEPNETDREALVRELSEELGVDIIAEELVETTFSTSPEIEMASYKCRLLGDRPTQSSDHDQLLWLHLDELETLDWAELDIPVVQKLISTGL